MTSMNLVERWMQRAIDAQVRIAFVSMIYSRAKKNKNINFFNGTLHLDVPGS